MPSARARAPRSPEARSSDIAEARRRGIDTGNKTRAALVSVDKPLTDQQRAFVKFWAQGESPLSAAHKAGYTDGGTSAYRMIYMPNVLALYQAEKEAYEAASGMNRKRVIDGFLEAIEMSKTMAEPSTMVAGWREIGKMCGYYEPVQVKHTISHEGKSLVDRMEKMSDDELFEIIEKRMQEQAAVEAQRATLKALPPIEEIPRDDSHLTDSDDAAEAPL